jgi:hypothetical protein
MVRNVQVKVNLILGIPHTAVESTKIPMEEQVEWSVAKGNHFNGGVRGTIQTSLWSCQIFQTIKQGMVQWSRSAHTFNFLLTFAGT